MQGTALHSPVRRDACPLMPNSQPRPPHPAPDAKQISDSNLLQLQTLNQLAALLPALRVAVGLVIAALVIAALYFGRDLLIPLALATLLGFLLDPLVDRLKRWGLPRVVAVMVVVVMTLGLLGAGGAYLANQASTLSGELPTYQKTIRDKLRNLRTFASGPSMWDGLISTIKTFEREVSRLPPSTGSRAEPGGARSGPVTKVEIVEPEAKPVQLVMGWLGRASEPLATAGIVLLFVILILLDRGDLRDRVLRLMGGNLHLATDALDEASERISSYLRMQLLVNLSYGIPMAIGLWVIGVPGAVLWGVTAAIMRFIPYVGAMISAIFPVLLAFAVAPGWDMVLWTVSLIVVLELISNNLIEPWLYGESTGLSTLSIILSATFWTALWGPVGLILATPLTVCLLVLGRYLPSLKFLDLLLGSEPVLDAPHRLYQRLLAGDIDDALELAQSEIDTAAGPKPDQADLAAGVTQFYDATAVPMLRLGVQQHQEATSEQRLRLATGMKAMMKELQEEYPAPPYVQALLAEAARLGQHTGIHCLGARLEVDAASAAMVAHALSLRGLPASATAWAVGAQQGDADLRVGSEVQVVCLCSFNPTPQTQVRQLIRRLRRHNPNLTVLVAAWNASDDMQNEDAAQRMGAADVVDNVEGVVLRAQAMLQADAEAGWCAPERPDNDSERVQALHDSGLLNPALVPLFHEAARQACNAFDMPFAQVALVDRDWVHTPGSLLQDQDGQTMESGLPRDQSLCGWVVAEDKVFVIEDVARDPRFAQNPALTAHDLHFYAGVPLRIKNGPVLGSFEVLDTKTRDLQGDELELLADMAAQLVKDARVTLANEARSQRAKSGRKSQREGKADE